jgi:Polysaccharide lyase/Bacterial Ig domain
MARRVRRCTLWLAGIAVATLGMAGTAQAAADTTPPSLEWVAPASGATVTGQLSETNGNCYVNATDASGISHAEFYLDGVALNDEAYVPYSCNWDIAGATPGAHTLEAKAFDTAGNSSTASVSVSVDTGDVLWRADGEQSLVNEWAEYSTTANCAVTSDTVTTDNNALRESPVTAKGSYAYQFVVNDGDNCYGERAELGQALPSRTNFTASRLFNNGDDRWISFQVRLASDFPINTPYWNVIAQWKQLIAASGTDGSPVLAMQVRDGRYYLENNASDGSWKSIAVASAVSGRWAHFSMRVKFSPDSSVGFVEIWGDPDGAGMRQLLAPTHMATLRQQDNGTPVPSHARIGIYRDSRISGTSHLYYDGYTVATDRSAAEAGAF